MVLEFGTAAHDRARLFGAELGYAAVEKVYPVEEVHYVHGDPVVVLVLFGHFDHVRYVDARVERLIRIFVQVEADCARLEFLFRSESLAKNFKLIKFAICSCCCFFFLVTLSLAKKLAKALIFVLYLFFSFVSLFV
jgi:hypothetical protein